MNPAQSFLLELKTVAIRQLPFEDAWKMFGVGIHPNIDELFRNKLAPFLSQGAQNFWSRKLYYFKVRAPPPYCPPCLPGPIWGMTGPPF